MREITETITISKERHDELLRKEFSFEAYKRKVKNDKKKGAYLTDIERALFLEEEEKLEIPTFLMVEELSGKTEEEPEERISDEIWDEIEAMVEKEEDNATETV